MHDITRPQEAPVAVLAPLSVWPRLTALSRLNDGIKTSVKPHAGLLTAAIRRKVALVPLRRGLGACWAVLLIDDDPDRGSALPLDVSVMLDEVPVQTMLPAAALEIIGGLTLGFDFGPQRAAVTDDQEVGSNAPTFGRDHHWRSGEP